MADPQELIDELTSVENDVLAINESELDADWIRQPKLMNEYAKKLAMARSEHERAKSNLEVVHAELSKKIRSAPDAYELAKPTEASIEACIITRPKYIKAQERMHDWKLATDLLNALVTALDHKRRALENMVQLFGMSYFGAPKARSEEIEDSMKRRARKAGRK